MAQKGKSFEWQRRDRYGMNEIEITERLTGIIKEQAEIICELYSVVQQLGAVTSIAERVEAIIKEAGKI